MGRRKPPKMASYLYDQYPGDSFAMIPPDLFESTAFQGLSYAARCFYLMITAHVTSYSQKTCLFRTLEEYNEILQLDMSQDDIKLAVWGSKRQHKFSTLFVLPAKHLEVYGFSKQYANKLKKELIEKGFIKIKYGGKGRYNGWNENVTVYEFSDKWKTNSLTDEKTKSS